MNIDVDILLVWNYFGTDFNIIFLLIKESINLCIQTILDAEIFHQSLKYSWNL